MKPEAGKFYRTRNGKKAGPMKYVRRAFPFEGLVDGGLESWSEAGSYRLGVSDHPLDLVAEWTIHDDANVKFDAEKNDSIDAPMEMYDMTLDDAELATAAMAPGYGDLHEILQDAFDQSASGKGKERHANDKPFDRQPIMEIGRMVGPGYAIGQAMKKLQEAMTMQSRSQHDPADRELLGAIVYAAAAVKLIRENRAA